MGKKALHKPVMYNSNHRDKIRSKKHGQKQPGSRQRKDNIPVTFSSEYQDQVNDVRGSQLLSPPQLQAVSGSSRTQNNQNQLRPTHQNSLIANQEGNMPRANSRSKVNRNSLNENINGQLGAHHESKLHKLGSQDQDMFSQPNFNANNFFQQPDQVRRNTVSGNSQRYEILSGSHKPPLSNQSQKGKLGLAQEAYDVSHFGEERVHASSAYMHRNNAPTNSLTAIEAGSFQHRVPVTSRQVSMQIANNNQSNLTAQPLKKVNSMQVTSPSAVERSDKNSNSNNVGVPSSEEGKSSSANAGMFNQIRNVFTGMLWQSSPQDSESGSAKNANVNETLRQDIFDDAVEEISPAKLVKPGSQDTQTSVKMFNNIQESGLEKCVHCGERFDELTIESHQKLCADELTKQRLRDEKLIPSTKIPSIEINQINMNPTFDNDELSSSCGERTPSRKTGAQATKNSFSEQKKGKLDSAMSQSMKNIVEPSSSQVLKEQYNHPLISVESVSKSKKGQNQVRHQSRSSNKSVSTLKTLLNNTGSRQKFGNRDPNSTRNKNKDQFRFDKEIISGKSNSGNYFGFSQALPGANENLRLSHGQLNLKKTAIQDVYGLGKKEQPQEKEAESNAPIFDSVYNYMMGGSENKPFKLGQGNSNNQESTRQSLPSGKPPMSSQMKSQASYTSSRSIENNSSGGRNNFQSRGAGNAEQKNTYGKVNAQLNKQISKLGQQKSSSRDSNDKFGSRRNTPSSSSPNNQSPFDLVPEIDQQKISPKFNQVEESKDDAASAFMQLPTGTQGMILNKQGKPGSASCSTNDQSVPSPNLPASNNAMQVRTQILTGMTPEEALEHYESELTPFEMTELNSFDFIYTVGSHRVSSLRQVATHEGFYQAHLGEQLGYRYQVDKIIDAGAFGQVVRCLDMKENGRPVALKISKNKSNEMDNARVEAKLLKRILGKDPDKYGIVKMEDDFSFRRFYIIVFELLDMNLYKYIKQPSFRGMNKDLLRQIASQMLQGLQHLAKLKIIHCDLKPENVLFTDDKRTSVKIIDFGSSCTDFQSGFLYVQSRYYRSPEVVMGLPYDQAVDMWSFGCILAELVTGRPLFPAIDENELMELYRIRIGRPPQDMIKRCRKRKMFFNFKGEMLRSKRSRVPYGAADKSDSIRQTLKSEGDEDFSDFIEKCLAIDPKERLTPEQALKHNWIKRSKLQSVFKENQMTNQLHCRDLEDVLRPLPSTKQERAIVKRQLQIERQKRKMQAQSSSNQAATSTTTHSMGQSQSFQNLPTADAQIRGNTLANSQKNWPQDNSVDNAGNLSFRPNNAGQ